MSHPVRLRRRQIGMVPRMLMASLAAVIVAVLVVQLWTLHVVRAYQMKTMQSMLASDMSLLIRSFGVHPDWARDASGHLTLNGQSVVHAEDAVRAVREITGADATIFDDDVRMATTLSGAGGVSLVGSRLPPGPLHDRLLTEGKSYSGSAMIAGIPYLTVYQPILDRQGRPLGILFAGTTLTGASAVMRKIVQESLLIGLLVIIVVGCARGWMLRSSVRPLTALAVSVRKIATGDLEHVIPCAERTDQLGDIGRAIETLRLGAQAARKMEAQAAAERMQRDRSQAAMDQLTRDFATTISGVLVKLGRSADDVRRAAVDMTDVANQTRTDMLHAAGNAETSAQNLSSVAAATDELTANGNEISRQIGQVSMATGRAVTQAQTTAQTVEGLDETARQINAVVGLISQIAGQTNLLALNATIEAARAGEAGKGFAVVASEVKQLAAQTNQATARIGEQITAIQAATTDVVSAVRDVSGAIAQAGEAAATIAASVNEQGAATQEIAMQVQKVSLATVDANRAMNGASDLAARSEERSRSVVTTADQVAAVTATLQAEVDDFLAATKASWQSGDRRRYERLDGQGLRAKLACTTYGTGEGVIANISLGGIAIACSWPCDVGNEVMVELPAADRSVSARIVASQDNLLELAFRQDQATLGEIGKTVGLIESRAAGMEARAA